MCREVPREARYDGCSLNTPSTADGNCGVCGSSLTDDGAFGCVVVPFGYPERHSAASPAQIRSRNRSSTREPNFRASMGTRSSTP